MTEIAIHEQQNTELATVTPPVPQFAQQDSQLLLWAAEARQAASISMSLAKTSFVPSTMRGKPEEIAATILAGHELGLPPMAALRSIDLIQGVPALRAHAMRGLVQSRGHKVELVEASPTRVVVRGKRKGEQDWQSVEWTIQRAAQLGLTSKPEWKKQPQTMLIARATGEICRLIAADALYAMPYAVEELDPVTAAVVGSAAHAVTVEEVLGSAQAVPDASHAAVAENVPADNGYEAYDADRGDSYSSNTCDRCGWTGHHPDACPTLDEVPS